MPKTIIPLYNAEPIDFTFNTNPQIKFEKWNRQIAHVAAHPEDAEDIPDAVAIFDPPMAPKEAFEKLSSLGLNILPLIFGKSYYIYQVADEKHSFFFASTSFSLNGKGRSWIMPGRLQSFLDAATNNLQKYEIHLALNLRYEADFRASSAQVKFFLYWLILEVLSNKFIEDKSRKAPISDEAIVKMLKIAEEELIAKGELKAGDSPLKSSAYNLINQNIRGRLTQKSSVEMISEFLIDKCKLTVTKEEIRKLSGLRGSLVHSAKMDLEAKNTQMLVDADYLSRIAIIICLLDFDSDFQRYLIPHQRPGNAFFEWK